MQVHASRIAGVSVIVVDLGLQLHRKSKKAASLCLFGANFLKYVMIVFSALRCPFSLERVYGLADLRFQRDEKIRFTSSNRCQFVITQLRCNVCSVSNVSTDRAI